MTLKTLTAENFFADRLLPVSLFYTHSSEAVHWHNHEFSEICIVFEGHGIYETDFSVSEISAGDVLVLPAGGIHRFHNEVGIEQFNILFQFEKLPVPSREISCHPGFSVLFRINPQYCIKNRYYPHFKLCREDLLRVKNILSDAYQAQKMHKSGFVLSVYGAFLQVIPILLENYAKSNSDTNTPVIPARLSEALDYLQNNFRNPISINELARRHGMNVSGFIRHFKEATGRSPLSYLLNLRLEEARQLLQEDTLSITEIAFQVGFEDSNYFSRIFRRKNGLSPREFRRRLQEK